MLGFGFGFGLEGGVEEDGGGLWGLLGEFLVAVAAEEELDVLGERGVGRQHRGRFIQFIIKCFILLLVNIVGLCVYSTIIDTPLLNIIL